MPVVRYCWDYTLHYKMQDPVLLVCRISGTGYTYVCSYRVELVLQTHRFAAFGCLQILTNTTCPVGRYFVIKSNDNAEIA